MEIKITHNGNHEYHLENLDNSDQHRDIEVYLDGMFVNSYDNLLSAIGHCLDKRAQQKDIGFVTRMRA